MIDDSDGVVREIEGGWEIRFERRLSHPPAKVWAAITQPGRMSQWFDRTEFPTELKPGGVIEFFHERAGLRSQGRILAVDPPRLIEWQWTSDFSTPSLCRWEIHPTTDGCVLLMSQTTDQPGVLARTTAGWHVCLERLQLALDGQPAEGDLNNWKPRFERYVRQLAGLAADAQIKRDGPGVEARFDRTLPHPIEAVWSSFLIIGKSVDARLGGQVRFGDDADKPTTVAEVDDYDPPKRLRAHWSDGAFFLLELTDLGGVAQITLTFAEPTVGENTARHIAEWHAQLDRLARRLDGEPERAGDVAGLAEKYGREMRSAG